MFAPPFNLISGSIALADNTLNSYQSFTFFITASIMSSANMTLSGALSLGNIDLARQMLEAGADANGQCQRDWLLHIATRENNLRGVQVLLEYGADVNIKNRYTGDTALHVNCIHDCELYELLLEAGADCDARNSSGVTPLLYALRHSSIKSIQSLLDHGADISAIDVSSSTALHYAVQNYRVDVVLFVLKQGINIECRDNMGYSPLQIAAILGTPDLCELLLRRGAMVNTKIGNAGHSLLSFAISETRRTLEYLIKPAPYIEYKAQVIHLLLEFGAQVAHEVDNKTILEIVAQEDVIPVHALEGWCIMKNVLMQHMARMRYLNLEINDRDRQTIENDDCYREYYQMCLKELENMEETKFYRNVSIFSIFVGSLKVISGYARNEELVRAFGKEEYANKFPIYYARLRKRFSAEVERQKSRNLAAENLSSIFKFNDLSHPVNRTVLNFFDDEDVTFLIGMNKS